MQPPAAKKSDIRKQEKKNMQQDVGIADPQK